jgi:hypothetical protein
MVIPGVHGTPYIVNCFGYFLGAHGAPYIVKCFGYFLGAHGAPYGELHPLW